MMYASSKKILVIEDDTVTLDLFLVALEAEGFETIGAENGFMGIQLAQTHQPDLVICDILMPDIDGYSVLMTLRQNPVTAVIPFIFLTGSKTNADFRKGMELGADDYIMKPSTIEEVLRAIAIRLEKQALFSNWFSSNSQTNPASSPGNSTPAESIFPLVPQFKKVFDFIEANYCQGITLSHVAKAVGYTAPYLTHRLAEKTGDTVNGWIVRRKMAAARSLLVNTTQTIEQIALALGYQNSCHFSRQFRQYHSLPPKNWRKQNQPPQVARSAKVKIIQTRNFVNDYRPVDS
ncbi:response regulator [Fortiea contorta]|uniref:response regulator transcription factor n=1 Tax=Fortiea contorta TaxID=1892405 RepID=UPI00058E2C9F|nr:response regulator [Fortiea contorta]